MADTETQTFAQVDITKPVYLVFHQTETRNNIEVLQGLDAEAEAKARARQKAVRAKATVCVFGPQLSAYAPPKPSTAEEVQLDWMTLEGEA